MKLTLSNIGTITQDSEGRFSLNDFHRAAGGERKHEVTNWLNLQSTQELIDEVEKLNTGIPVINSLIGRNGGTFVCKELVYAYAMWISAAFQLKVIRAFDALVTGDVEKAQQIASGKTSGLEEIRKAKAIAMQMDNAERIWQYFPSLGNPARQEIAARLVNGVAGYELIPAARISHDLWSASEIGALCGVSKNRVGILANAYNLKTPEFSECLLSKSQHADKQVTQYMYNEKGKNLLVELIKKYKEEHGSQYDLIGDSQ